MERCVRAAVAAALAALVIAPGAGAGPRLIVGVADDWLKWVASPDRIVDAYDELNIGAVRVTLRWQPGEYSLDSVSRLQLRRVVGHAPGTVRIVLAVYGTARDAPSTADERMQYCSFVADALSLAPYVEDVVI